MEEPGFGCGESTLRDDGLNRQAMAREGEYSAHYSGGQQNIEESLHSQTSSELSVWVFTTTLWGRDFCPHLTHKEMWVETQWLPQELTLAMGSFYDTRLLSKLFENYLRHRISRNCLLILVNLCFSGFYGQVFGTTGQKQKPRESSGCQDKNHPQGPWPIVVNQGLA